MTILEDKRFHEQGYHNFEDNLAQPRHRWYPFKEGFSAELVSEALRSNVSGNKSKLRVLDPFCGSGTTPVVAALGGHEAHAIEVNPFCAFTSRVKCMPRVWRPRTFNGQFEQIAAEARSGRRHSPIERQSTFSEAGGCSKWLFNSSVLRAFEATWTAATLSGSTYQPAFQLAAIRAAMNCCNAKKDGKALRYYSDWQKRAYSADNFFEEFKAISSQFREDTELAPIDAGAKITIRNGDSRKALSALSKESFDLIVTSPPYLNSFDYSDVYRPELFLGKFVADNSDLRRVRLRTLRSHVQVQWKGDTSVVSTLLTEPLTQLRNSKSLWNGRLPEMVEAYFHDMHAVLMQCARVLKIGAEAWIVVSTSAYAGVQIPVDLILAELATNIGLKLKGVYVLRSLRSAGQQQSKFSTSGYPLRESLIVLVREK